MTAGVVNGENIFDTSRDPYIVSAGFDFNINGSYSQEFLDSHGYEITSTGTWAHHENTLTMTDSNTQEIENATVGTLNENTLVLSSTYEEDGETFTGTLTFTR